MYLLFFLLLASPLGQAQPAQYYTTTIQETVACPEGWVNVHDDGCFTFLGEDTRLSWFEASLGCEQAGGYLAEPQRFSQMDILTAFAGLEADFYGIRNWWIGLTDFSHEGTWIWQRSNQEAEEVFWGEGSPDNRTGNSLDCAHLALGENNQLTWKDISCGDIDASGQKIAPLCQRGDLKPDVSTTTATGTTTGSTAGSTAGTTAGSTAGTTAGTTSGYTTRTTSGYTTRTTSGYTTGTTAGTTAGSTAGTTAATTAGTTTGTTTSDDMSECPDGWSKMDTSCYWVVFDEVDWVEAQNGCSQLHPGAHLASSGSELENEFITKLHPGDPSYFWLGGEDFKEEGNWVWTDGTPFTFTNWLTNSHGTQGTGGPAQNCLAINTNGNGTNGNDYYTDKWYDYECYATHAYMCEINLGNQ